MQVLEQQRQAEPEQEFEWNRKRREVKRVPEGVPEPIVGDQEAIICEPRELTDSEERKLPKEAQKEHHEHRIDRNERKQDEGRQHEPESVVSRLHGPASKMRASCFCAEASAFSGGLIPVIAALNSGWS